MEYWHPAVSGSTVIWKSFVQAISTTPLVPSAGRVMKLSPNLSPNISTTRFLVMNSIFCFLEAHDVTRVIRKEQLQSSPLGWVVGTSDILVYDSYLHGKTKTDTKSTQRQGRATQSANTRPRTHQKLIS
jgi:hypothetical protein